MCGGLTRMGRARCFHQTGGRAGGEETAGGSLGGAPGLDFLMTKSVNYDPEGGGSLCFQGQQSDFPGALAACVKPQGCSGLG